MSLDDALNSSSVLFDGSDLTVGWKELPSTESTGVENLKDMGDTLSGYSVTQSFDDGLPDPVTMSGGNDAAGKASISLIGRAGHVFSTWASSSGIGQYASTSTAVSPTIPAGAAWGDFVLVFLAVPVATSELYNEEGLPGVPNEWVFLGRQNTSTMALHVYAKPRWNDSLDHNPVWVNTFGGSFTNAVYGVTAIGAKDPAGNELAWRAKIEYQGSAGGAATVHTVPAISTTTRRAVVYSVWVSTGAVTWTVNAPNTSVGVFTSTTTSMAIGRTGLLTEPTRITNLAATASASTSNVAMFTVSLEPFERPTWGPTEFWSPFNRDSPITGLDRDTADVRLDFNTITSAGVESTTIFNGQMDDITVGGGQAVSMEASSEVRITLNKSLNLPIMYGRREGGQADWLIAWIMARANRFIGPAPGPQARWWVPGYGSVHAALDAFNGFNWAVQWINGIPSPVRYPEFVEGPFHTAIMGRHLEQHCTTYILDAFDLYKSDEIWPWVLENYPTNDYLLDMFSSTQFYGRISFWIRGDPAFAGTPNGVPSSDRYLWQFRHEVKNAGGTTLGIVWFYFDTDRNLYLHMNGVPGGGSTVTFGASTVLPTDGDWHFYSIAWDWSAGSAEILFDGDPYSATATWVAATNPGDLYATDAETYAAGGRINTWVRGHMPLSDLIVESGQSVWADATSGAFSQVWPAYPWPSFTAITRVTDQPIEAITDDSPVNGWAALAELARNTMSWYRATEWDDIEFLPPAYFGESAQQVVEYVVDTELNAQELAVTADPSKSRNVVTVKFMETSVDELYSTALSLATAVEIPRGTTELIFTLDEPVAEIHGAATPYDAIWSIHNLNDADVTTGPSAISDPSLHYMSVNSISNGTGSYLNNTQVSGRIIDYTQTTVTIRFINTTAGSAWLTNDYQGDIPLPFLMILGWRTREVQGYSTERDLGSIGNRRERAMEVEMRYVHRRWDAQQMASQMVALLARPRPEVSVVVMGDPRRVPGQLVSLADAPGTHADGNWRVISIEHNVSGPEYTQTLSLVGSLPIAEWDEGNWDLSSWGA